MRSVMYLLNSPFQRMVSLFCIGGLVMLIGCSGGPREAANSVKGKVTVQGNPVNAGTVTFHATVKDGKDASGPILNGSYRIEDPPVGQVKISVRGMPGIPGVEKKISGIEAPKDAASTLAPAGASQGVAP